MEDLGNAFIWLGPLSALLSSLTWAVGSETYSRLSRRNSAFRINFTRASVALPMFLLMAISLHGVESVHAITLQHVGWLLLSMIASYGLADFLFLTSTRDLGVPGALSVASIYPIWTVLLGVIRGDQWLRPVQWLGLVLTLGGVIFTVLAGAQTGGKSAALQGRTVRGVLFASITSFLWAMNSFSVAQAGSDLPVHWVNVIRMALALAFCGLVGWWSEGRRSVARSETGVSWRPWLRDANVGRSFWVFPFEAFGGSLFFAYGLAHSPLALGSTLSSLAPVLAVPLAWINRSEEISFRRAFGVIAVVVGVALLLGGGVNPSSGALQVENMGNGR